MDNIFVDTNILIDFSKGFSDELGSLIKKQNEGKVVIYINPVVVAEYFTDKNLTELENQKKAQQFIQIFSIKNVTKDIGIRAGQLMRDKDNLFLGDALIAATCLEENYLLYTRNKKHFRSVRGLELF